MIRNQDSHIFFFKPGNLGYPVFQTQYGKVGVYICYDRHFPEGARALGLNRPGRERGAAFTTISTSLFSALRNRISRSTENPSSRPRCSAETLG